MNEGIQTEHGFVCSIQCFETERTCSSILDKALGTGSASTAIPGAVNTYADTVIFGAERGHGIAAERANHEIDVLRGQEARHIGGNNAKNGADRLVNGINIQSKYCQSGSKCIAECFDENGAFRYRNVDGSPLQIEVPSDHYEDAVKALENRIRRGQIPGITDPAKAKDIVRKGALTYQQARNVAKFCTVESITYDAIKGIQIAGTAYTVTVAISFAHAVWQGEDWNAALKHAVSSGLKVGGAAWLTSIISAQLARTGVEGAMRPATDFIVKKLGAKTATQLANALRNGSSIHGAAAMSHLSKVLRGNVVTGVVTTVVLSSADISRLVRGRISGLQAFKNISSTAAGVAGGTGGWMAGAAAGAALGSVVPLIGTAAGGLVGGLLGAFAGGSLGSSGTKAILDCFIEDDAKQMSELIESELIIQVAEFMLDEAEIARLLELVEKIDFGKELQNIYASSNRKGYLAHLIKPLAVTVVAERHSVTLPSEVQLLESIGNLIETP